MIRCDMSFVRKEDVPLGPVNRGYMCGSSGLAMMQLTHDTGVLDTLASHFVIDPLFLSRTALTDIFRPLYQISCPLFFLCLHSLAC